MAASMKGLDPELKKFLRDNKLPDVYEALLTGLAVMCPDDPIQFLLDKLAYIKATGLDCLQWDMFVEPDMKPHPKVVYESSLDFIFNLDENMTPSMEMYSRAYGHYNTRLMKMCYRGWVQYFLRKKRRRRILQRKMKKATLHHSHRVFRLHLNTWKEWVRFRKGRQAMSYQKLQHVYHISLGRVIFEAWHIHTLDARKTREYFERLERGENMEDEETIMEGTGEARDSISMLPKVVALQIFNNLDIADLARCACVCRSWKMFTQCSVLWSRLDISSVKHRVTDKVAVRLLSKCRPYLVHLNLRECGLLSKPTFLCISECRNLQDLNLSECVGLNDEMVKLLAMGCRVLLYLNISHTEITDATLRCIAKDFNNLQFLSIAFCKKFTDRGLHYLGFGKNSLKLEYLDMSGCLQITPEGFENLSRHCHNLQALQLNEFPTLNDDCVQPLLEKCIKLTKVSFLGSPLLTDETFKRLAQAKGLQTIKLEGNHRISDVSIKLLGRSCPNLEHIYLADCQRLTDISLRSLANCKNLTVLNVADCVRMSDTGVRYLVDGLCGPKLRELNLTNCIRVGDMAMVSIHKRCHNLTYLSVCFCEHISEAGIELIGQMHSITSLDISGSNCGDQGLSALGNNAGLRDVTLSECSNITDLGLQKFAQQCKEVARLDLSHCLALTDGALKNLAFCCRLLNCINLSGCKLLTDLSIQYISGVCHYLYSLDISGCTLVTDKSLKYLRKGCKRLRFLTMLYCKGIPKKSALKMIRHVETVQHNSEPVPIYFGY